jgi:hypothetical protein
MFFLPPGPPLPLRPPLLPSRTRACLSRIPIPESPHKTVDYRKRQRQALIKLKADSARPADPSARGFGGLGRDAVAPEAWDLESRCRCRLAPSMCPRNLCVCPSVRRSPWCKTPRIWDISSPHYIAGGGPAQAVCRLRRVEGDAAGWKLSVGWFITAGNGRRRGGRRGPGHELPWLLPH